MKRLHAAIAFACSFPCLALGADALQARDLRDGHATVFLKPDLGRPTLDPATAHNTDAVAIDLASRHGVDILDASSARSTGISVRATPQQLQALRADSRVDAATGTVGATAVNVGALLQASDASVAVAPANLNVSSAACSVSYTISKRWTGGFNADVVLTNRSASTINGWQANFTFTGGEKISNSWRSGVVTAGPAAELKGASYNTVLAAGKSVSFGFTASGLPKDPSGFKLNGKSCQTGTTPPPPPPPPPQTACSNSSYGIPQAIRIHTLYDTSVSRSDFSKNSRWYSESGNTQIFKLFNGEYNHANPDHLNPRIEAFSYPKWQSTNANQWHEFSADYTIVKTGNSQRSLFQMKSDDTAVQWEVHIELMPNGDVVLNHRRLTDKVLEKNMLGKTFNVRIRSNGRRYQVYYKCNLIADVANQMDPSGKSSYAWRWGMYPREQIGDSEVHVRGARFN